MDFENNKYNCNKVEYSPCLTSILGSIGIKRNIFVTQFTVLFTLLRWKSGFLNFTILKTS